MKQAQIFRNDIQVGILSRLDNNTFEFKYDEDYLLSTNPKNISVNFPLQEEPFSSIILFAFFFNMLAEGNIKKSQCRNMKIDENDSFTRLLKTVNDDVIGSIRVKEIE